MSMKVDVEDSMLKHSNLTPPKKRYYYVNDTTRRAATMKEQTAPRASEGWREIPSPDGNIPDEYSQLVMFRGYKETYWA